MKKHTKYLFWLGISVALTVFFHLTYSFHSSLEVSVSPDLPRPISVKWDSGDGYNTFETAQFQEGSVTLKLPRVAIEKVKIIAAQKTTSHHTITIRNDTGGTTTHPFDFDQLSSEINIEADFRELSKPVFLIFQAGLSIVLTYFLWMLFHFRSSLILFFRSREGQVFLALNLTSFAVHGLYIIAHFPATTSNDSINSLSEALRLAPSSWQPYTYAYFLLACLHLGGVWVSSLIQLLATTLTINTGFFLAHRHGVRWFWIAPFYIWFLMATPVGYMNTIVWKDVLFSIAVVAMSLMLFYTRLLKLQNQLTPFIKAWNMPLLFLALSILFTFRHNGIIYYPILPFLAFFCLTFVDFAKLSALVASVYLVFQVAIPNLTELERISGSHLHELRTVLSIMDSESYFSENLQRDIEAVEKATEISWKKLSDEFPENWFWVWDNSRLSKFMFEPEKGYIGNYTKSFVIEKILTNPGPFLIARARDFSRTSGIEPSFSSAANQHIQAPTYLDGTSLAPPGLNMWEVQIKAPVISNNIRTNIIEYQSYWKKYSGFFSPQPFMWGIHIPLFLLLIALIVQQIQSPIFFFGTSILSTAGIIFLVGSENCWRYYYAVYLTVFMTIPLLLMTNTSPRTSLGDSSV